MTSRPARSFKATLFSLLLIILAPFTISARLGDKLEDAQKTDFFKFFNLGETGRTSKPSSPYTYVSFKPRAGNFRELVTVNVTLDKEGRIMGMQAELLRSFVDHPLNGIFARDIAKSLLRSAVPARDEMLINDLANEIEFPKELPDVNIVRTQPDPKLPAQATPGYLVFIGKQRAYQRDLSASKIALENVGEGETQKLVISVNSKELK